MVGGCLSCFFTYISVLLLWVCLHDVETSSCEQNINKKVGDTVELPSCLPAEGVTLAQWKHGGFIIIEDKNVNFSGKFKGRLELNPTSFYLTVRRLTVQDSGNFSFISAVKDAQRTTVTITLHVHEPITAATVTSNSTWNAVNESCTVLLECSGATDSSVTYSWAVRNQTMSGSRLRYSITPQDGDTGFTCTISNFVSEKSTIKAVMCSNSTSDPSKTGPNFPILLGAAGGGCLMIVVIVGVAVYVCHCKQSKGGSDTNVPTVYAEVALEAGTSLTMKPCTLYETIENRVDTVTPGPQTVYDKIQLSRMSKASV
ncbi:SLAM family member 5 [Anarrhichthys ocellatus]|uniref:SLAM family member 5 n=1 Tax=Anarrhichthys ocellatus TaxID=433405 RepID=UPI0012ED0F27|nr:SLAM family member 5-like [Anarrhichthys ocellatus]